jgi:hypothetical protein
MGTDTPVFGVVAGGSEEEEEEEGVAEAEAEAGVLAVMGTACSGVTTETGCGGGKAAADAAGDGVGTAVGATESVGLDDESALSNGWLVTAPTHHRSHERSKAFVRRHSARPPPHSTALQRTTTPRAMGGRWRRRPPPGSRAPPRHCHAAAH